MRAFKSATLLNESWRLTRHNLFACLTQDKRPSGPLLQASSLPCGKIDLFHGIPKSPC